MLGADMNSEHFNWLQYYKEKGLLYLSKKSDSVDRMLYNILAALASCP
jgi:hypothetical protein